jgi:hypothetical protein
MSDISRPGKRFQGFSMRAIDFSHENTPYDFWKKNFWKFFTKNSKVRFFWLTLYVYFECLVKILTFLLFRTWKLAKKSTKNRCKKLNLLRLHPYNHPRQLRQRSKSYNYLLAWTKNCVVLRECDFWRIFEKNRKNCLDPPYVFAQIFFAESALSPVYLEKARTIIRKWESKNPLTFGSN